MAAMENLLENLNPEQLAAVTHTKGPLMIVAGAGTGKTTVITQRIAWLIEQGHAKPENILALTFTDKAAGEMEERVDMLLPIGYVNLQISTFHAFCESLLREYGAEMGLARDFRVLTELDAWLLVRQHFDRFELDYFRPMGNPTKYLRGLLTHFSRAKDSAVTTDEYVRFAQDKAADKDTAQSSEDAEEHKRLLELANAYNTYQRILSENDALDFGDLLMLTLKLLRERPAILKRIRETYSWVLVDEFQDTNFAQYEIVKLIAAPKNNLTVVGDDDQAIYKFRGASLANILQFNADYTDAKKIVLTKNYRSAQAILDHAYRFIQKNNPNRLEAQDASLCKKLQAEREGGGSIEHLHCATIQDETDAVCAKILALKEAHPDASWNDFAILVRGNDAAVPFVAALDRRKIPYQFLALRGLYTKPAVLDMLAMLHVIDNPFDSPSFYRLLNVPMYGISHAAIASVSQLANRKGKALAEAAQMARSFSEFTDADAGGLNRVLSDAATFRAEAAKRKGSEILLTAARESGYVEYLNTLPEREKQDAFKHLQSFYERMKRFEERHHTGVLRHFLEEFREERDAGEEGALSVDLESGPDMVRIMTVHASKGLEFRFVFVVNLVDRRFPAQARAEAIPLPEGLVNDRMPEGDWHIEEERRLFYVAMTRAKDALYFTSADDYGGTRARKLSRFLDELGYEKPAAAKGAERNPFLAEQVEIEADDNGELVYRLPKQFSFTQLVAFRTCPLQYKFAHILKIPVFGKYQMSYGKTMHNTLQRFFQAWLERTGVAQASLFAPSAQVTRSGELPVSIDELYSMYADCWMDDWYPNDQMRQKYRTQGRDSLKSYYTLMLKDRPTPLSLEQPFTLKIGEVIVKGRIDRIDTCDGGIEIIDYKTGSPKKADKIAKEDKEQLYLYQLAARDILKLNPVKLTYHYLEDHSEISFIGDDDDLLTLQENVVERVRMIKESRFVATPGFHCKYCDFADICEFRES